MQKRNCRWICWQSIVGFWFLDTRFDWNKWNCFAEFPWPVIGNRNFIDRYFWLFAPPRIFVFQLIFVLVRSLDWFSIDLFFLYGRHRPHHNYFRFLILWKLVWVSECTAGRFSRKRNKGVRISIVRDISIGFLFSGVVWVGCHSCWIVARVNLGIVYACSPTLENSYLPYLCIFSQSKENRSL